MKNSNLKSRKLWTAIAGLISGLAVVFGASDGAVQTIAGAVIAIISVVAYIITEGKIDTAALEKMNPEIKEILEILSRSKEGK